MTRVVHCKREKYDVYIGRPSKWGNPSEMENGSDAERQRVIGLYHIWLQQPAQEELRRAAVTELKGKVLGCWCSPKPCHGDILAEIADN